MTIIYSEIPIFRTSKETKIGLKNQIVKEIRVTLQHLTEEGNNFWFDLLEGSKN